MAHPVRKHTRSRTGKRRTHWKLSLSTVSACDQTGKPVLRHRVSPYSGQYRGKQLITIKPKVDKKAAASS